MKQLLLVNHKSYGKQEQRKNTSPSQKESSSSLPTRELVAPPFIMRKHTLGKKNIQQNIDISSSVHLHNKNQKNSNLSYSNSNQK
jgi:hypothetical protein